MRRKRRVVANLLVGRPDTSPDAPSHVAGVRQGNAPGGFERQAGFYSVGPMSRRGISDARGTAARATGINPRARDPIDPRSPNLMPP